MQQEYFFNHAKWVGIADRTRETFSILRGHFYADAMCKAELYVVGTWIF